MKKGNEYEMLVSKTQYPGIGVSFCDDKKVYIKNALPGEKVLVRITKKKKDYMEAKIVKILEDVDYKIKPLCSKFGECGGCTRQDVPYDIQIKCKEREVLDLFKDAGISGFNYLGIEKSPEEFGYRNKMEFTFGDYEKDGELSLGMHGKNGPFRIINACDCAIVDSDYRMILKTVLEYFKDKGLKHYRVLNHVGYLRNLVIRKAKNTGEILVNIVTTSQEEFDLSEISGILQNLSCSGKLKGIIHTVCDTLADAVKPDSVEILYGRDYIIEELLGLKFKISPFSFFQTNSKGAEKLYSIVKSFISDTSSKVMFDLYCGTGTIGQIVAHDAQKVIGIELVEEAVSAANENAKLNGLENCNFIAGDVAKVIKTLDDKPDVIIVDPPRTGIHPAAIGCIVDFNAPEIIYVSCNPKTLMNDLKFFMAHGYEVDSVKIMDMFPQTGHVETVVRIYRK